MPHVVSTNKVHSRATPGLGYLEALTQPNVQVLTESIQEVVKDGIKLKSGEVILVDVIICATGFDLSWKPRFPIIGRDGTNLQDQFKDRPKGYLGIAVPNLPNYMGIFAKYFSKEKLLPQANH